MHSESGCFLVGFMTTWYGRIYTDMIVCMPFKSDTPPKCSADSNKLDNFVVTLYGLKPATETQIKREIWERSERE